MKHYRFLLLWLIATSQHLRLPPNGSYALSESSVDECYRRILLEIQMGRFLWAKLLGRMPMSRRNVQYLLRRSFSNIVFPPLSLMPFPRKYEKQVCQAVSGAPKGRMFLTLHNYFTIACTNEWACEIDTVLEQITHRNGKFEALMTYGRVMMGRANCPLGLKMVVIESALFSKDRVTVCIFHPIAQMLICGHQDGTLKFWTFTDDSQSAISSFNMTLVASQLCDVKSSVKRITSNDSGSIFVVEYESSLSILVSIDTKNILRMEPFVPQSLVSKIGKISALAFFGSRILTTHYNKYCVWKIDESDGCLRLDSQIDQIINSRGFYPGRVYQIIWIRDNSFLFRTSESIFFVRLTDNYTKCQIVHEQRVYDRFYTCTEKDLEINSLALNGNILIVVIPSMNILKIFLVDETRISPFLETTIKEPTSWTYNPSTSVLSYYNISNRSTHLHRIML